MRIADDGDDEHVLLTWSQWIAMEEKKDGKGSSSGSKEEAVVVVAAKRATTAAVGSATLSSPTTSRALIVITLAIIHLNADQGRGKRRFMLSKSRTTNLHC